MLKTTQRTLTKRGVIWLGQTCNLRCQFCYFADRRDAADHPEHPFMSLEKAKRICKTLVDRYGNNAVDLQGGEPTLFPGIFELISFCSSIGLKPTLITNGLVLDDIETCRQYRDGGIHDFLVSVHGLGDIHNRLVGRTDAHARQMKALDNLRDTGIPFRFNCVLSGPAVPQLPSIARLAVEKGARVVNFITFNPFADQAQKGKRSSENVPRYSSIRDALTEALDILDAADIEANVRYFPLCMLEERHRKSGYNFQQLPYDCHEWDYASWAWTGLRNQRTKQGELDPAFSLEDYLRMVRHKKAVTAIASSRFIMSMLSALYRSLKGSKTGGAESGPKEALYREAARVHASIHCQYRYSDQCRRCALAGICDGFHGDYAALFGMDETAAVETDEQVNDPLYYIRHQKKIPE